ADFLDEVFYSSLVDSLHLLQQRKITAGFLCDPDKNLNIFRETESAKTITGLRNDEPIRGSSPIPSATLVTSAPTTSQRSATMLMKDIFIARKELEACLMSSDEFVSVTKKRGVSRLAQFECTGQAKV